MSNCGMRRVVKCLAAAAVVLTVTLLSSAQPSAQLPTRIALVGGMLLTGYELPPIHHAAVIVEGNKIVEAGPASEIKIPSDATVIDTSGRTMLPGLIDQHAHIVLIGHGDYPRYFAWINKLGHEKTVPRFMELSARQMLMGGITTAVDLGGPLKESISLRDRINKGEVVGTRLLVSGPQLTRTPSLFPPEFLIQVKVTSPEQAAQEVEKLAAAGVDVIKGHSGLTFEDYKAMVEAAHKHGLKVYAHVYAESDVRHAFDAGVDVLAHVGSAGTTPPYGSEIIRDIVNSGRPIAVSAAHRAWIYPDTIEFPERLEDPVQKSMFPPEVWAEIQSSFKDWWTLGYFARASREVFFRERGLKQFIEAGAVMGMGTDSGTPANFQSEVIWREIKAHVDMGMPPLRAIAAATRVNAQIIGKGAQLGSIERGKIADIIVVRGNPLANIMALADVEVVMKDGKIYKGGQPTARTSSDAR